MTKLTQNQICSLCVQTIHSSFHLPMSDEEGGGRSKQQGYRLEYASSARAGCKGTFISPPNVKTTIWARFFDYYCFFL